MNKWNLREVKYLPQGYSNNASQLVATAVGRLCFCGYTPHRVSLLPVLSFVVSFLWIFCFTFLLRCLQRRSYFGIDSWLRMPSAVSSRNKIHSGLSKKGIYFLIIHKVRRWWTPRLAESVAQKCHWAVRSLGLLFCCSLSRTDLLHNCGVALEVSSVATTVIHRK